MHTKKVMWFGDIRLSLYKEGTTMIDTFIDHDLIDFDEHHENLYIACTTGEHGRFSWVGYPVYEKSEVLDIE